MTETSAFRRRQRAVRLAAGLAALALSASAAVAADVIPVQLDIARVTRLPDQVATIVIGNPLIADASIQAGGLMVLTGKGYGTTNLLALDRNGNVLSEQLIEVRGPSERVVVVYRGVLRESYSCTPDCDRRITLGDSPEFFESTIAQTSNRNGRALGSAGPAQGQLSSQNGPPGQQQQPPPGPPPR